MTDFPSLVDALPTGPFLRTFEGRRYRVTRSIHAGGRSVRVEAQELAGRDRPGFNLYRLSDGRRLLKPCEVPAEKVRRFVCHSTE